MTEPLLGTALLELSTDPTKLLKSFGETKAKAQEWGGQVGSIAKTAAFAFAGVGAAALGVVSGLSAMTMATVGAISEVARLKRETGLTAEQASALRYEGERLGIDVDALSKSVGALSKHLIENSDRFAELGIKVVKTKDGHIDLNATLGNTAQLFKTMPDGAEKTALAMELFGKSGKDMLPFLNKGRDGLAEMSAEAAKMGLVFDDKALAASKRLKEEQKDLGDRIEGLKNRVSLMFLPVLVEWTGGMLNLADRVMPKVQSAITAIGTVVPLVFGSLGEMFDVLTGKRPEAGGVLRQFVGDDKAAAIMASIANVRESVEKAFDFLKPIIQGAIEKVKELHKEFDTLPEPLKGLVAAGVALKATGADQTIFGIAGNLGQAAQGAIAVGIALKGIGPGIELLAAFGLEALLLNGVIGGVVGGLTSAAAAVGGFAIAAAPIALVAATAVLVVEAVLQVIETIQLVADNWDKVQYLWRHSVGEFLEFWGGVWKEISERPGYWLGRLAGFLIGWLINMVLGIIQFGGDAGAAFGDWIGSTGEQLFGFFLSLPIRLGYALGEMLGSGRSFAVDFLGWLGGLRDQVVELLQTLPGKMVEIGRGIIEGVWKGIQDNVGRFRDQVIGFFSGIIDSIKLSLGIHSPSEVTAEIGSQMAAGLAVGMLSGIPLVASASNALMGAAMLGHGLQTGGGRTEFERGGGNLINDIGQTFSGQNDRANAWRELMGPHPMGGFGGKTWEMQNPFGQGTLDAMQKAAEDSAAAYELSKGGAKQTIEIPVNLDGKVIAKVVVENLGSDSRGQGGSAHLQ